MKKIYSVVEEDTLLHIIVGRSDFKGSRVEIIDADNFLQAACIMTNQGDEFRPHRHIYKDIEYTKTIAQEGWIVMSGAIRCTLFDLDDTVIYSDVLEAGDMCFTLCGGHTYKTIMNNTFVLEVKSGHYLGQEKDKVFIKEKI